MAAPLPLTRPSARVRSLPRRKVGFPIVFGLSLAAVSLVPYLLAYAWTPPGHHFVGFFFIADDATTYLAKMRQGAAGAWLWADPYTSEPHQGVFVFGFYLLFGHLAALAHVPLIAAYHAARVSGALALVLAVDRLAHHLLAPANRRLALVIVMLGSGVGFAAPLAGSPAVFGHQLEALDLHLPELSGWYSVLAIPHFAWATALIALSFVGLMNIAQRPSLRLVLGTGLALTALAAIHPQMVAVILLIWVAYRMVLALWLYRPAWRTLMAEAAAFSLSLPLLAYSAWILFNDPTIASWAQQWRHQAPPAPSLLISLGLPLVAAGYGIWLSWRRHDSRLALMMVWLPLVLALLYLPNVANIQRRLLDGIYVPIGMLAAVGLTQALAGLPRLTARRLQRAFIAMSCLSSAVVLAIALRFASGAFADAYIDGDRWQALSWLAGNHSQADRALSSPGAGLFLPAWSGVPVYVGHYSETLDYFGKIRAVDAILGPGVDAQTVQAFFRENGLTLLFWGPDERRATPYEPREQGYLARIYDRGSVQIYRFQPPG